MWGLPALKLRINARGSLNLMARLLAGEETLVTGPGLCDEVLGWSLSTWLLDLHWAAREAARLCRPG